VLHQVAEAALLDFVVRGESAQVLQGAAHRLHLLGADALVLVLLHFVKVGVAHGFLSGQTVVLAAEHLIE